MPPLALHLPHASATAADITQLALLVNSTLDPTLAIYTEYANEVSGGRVQGVRQPR